MDRLSVVLVGDAECRAAIKGRLRGRRDVTLAGEIGAASALRLIPLVAPDVVVLEWAAADVNALTVLPWLHTLPGAPWIIALGATSGSAEQQLVQALGADAYATLDGPLPLAAALDQAAALHGPVPQHRAA
jgi:CheY-like chemotaxis protein